MHVYIDRIWMLWHDTVWTSHDGRGFHVQGGGINWWVNNPTVHIYIHLLLLMHITGAPNIGRRSLKTRLLAEYPDKYSDVIARELKPFDTLVAFSLPPSLPCLSFFNNISFLQTQLERFKMMKTKATSFLCRRTIWDRTLCFTSGCGSQVLLI